MLTPQEVQNKKFKQAMWGGYEMTAVDGFLETVTRDFSALFTENATLKKRLNSLTKKLEEYRKVDDDMRQALIEATNVAQKKIADANETAARIVEEARGETQQRLETITADIVLEEKRLDAARRETISFVNNLRKLYTDQMEKLSFIPESPLPPREVRKQNADKAAKEINQSLLESVAREENDEPTLLAPAALLTPPPAPAPVPLPAPPQEEEAEAEGEAPTAVFALNMDDLDEFEHEQDTEVPLHRPLDKEELEQNFGHRLKVKN